jgi:hypothetical protein
MNEKYYLIVLSLDPKKHIIKKNSENLKESINHWTRSLKIKDITIDQPFYDIGEKENHHMNLSIKTSLSKEDLLKGPFKGWIHTKGFVWIDEIHNFRKWFRYSRRNHYKLQENKFPELEKLLQNNVHLLVSNTPPLTTTNST